MGFTFNLQHFTTSTNTSVSNLLFADVGLQYAFKSATINLDWSNIFNQNSRSLVVIVQLIQQPELINSDQVKCL